jgi:hypothetical protein
MRLRFENLANPDMVSEEQLVNQRHTYFEGPFADAKELANKCRNIRV